MKFLERYLESSFFESGWLAVFLVYVFCIAAVGTALLVTH